MGDDEVAMCARAEQALGPGFHKPFYEAISGFVPAVQNGDSEERAPREQALGSCAVALDWVEDIKHSSPPSGGILPSLSPEEIALWGRRFQLW